MSHGPIKDCPKHGEYFVDAYDSPCPSCDDDLASEDEIRVACSKDNCDATEGIQSTYCGSLCEEHLAEHCEECEVCAKDFNS